MGRNNQIAFRRFAHIHSGEDRTPLHTHQRDGSELGVYQSSVVEEAGTPLEECSAICNLVNARA